MGKDDKLKAPAVNPQVPPATSSISANLQKDIELLVRGEHSDPFAVLGPHWVDEDGKHLLAIRVFRPNAAEVAVLWGKKAEPRHAIRIHPEGLFEARIPATGVAKPQNEAVPPNVYRLQIRFSDGNVNIRS